ncbi:hypothetical protein NSU_0293 [Novosphingobium pentaromativorans US6-1]|uniref:Uncharacterized protein n=1 Tax=Novosphingobium pentaromativorans US6-1 TaxID=1088721 RepID=G6E7F8_9SPHN|nr:hypothetical protein NSU_0293 [Novosphingobium pentaromativorans US6-1]
MLPAILGVFSLSGPTKVRHLVVQSVAVVVGRQHVGTGLAMKG